MLTEDQWQIIKYEIIWSFVRSSGPGGQKVNKTSSKAELRWFLPGTKGLKETDINWLLKKLESKLTNEQEIVIAADSFRLRERNKEAAEERLFNLLVDSLKRPVRRKKTRPSKSAVEKRLKQKQQHADKKSQRRKVDY